MIMVVMHIIDHFWETFSEINPLLLHLLPWLGLVEIILKVNLEYDLFDVHPVFSCGFVKCQNVLPHGFKIYGDILVIGRITATFQGLATCSSTGHGCTPKCMLLLKMPMRTAQVPAMEGGFYWWSARRKRGGGCVRTGRIRMGPQLISGRHCWRRVSHTMGTMPSGFSTMEWSSTARECLPITRMSP